MAGGAKVQHALAREILAVAQAAYVDGTDLRYQELAARLGRDPETNSRAIAQACDLLDAAAAYAGIPLFALVVVRNTSGEVNPRAWSTGPLAAKRDLIIERSSNHQFTGADVASIESGLTALAGLGNRAAWRRVEQEGRTANLAGDAAGELHSVLSPKPTNQPTRGSWWHGVAAERYWLESTDREDLGADLRAPELDEVGHPNWRYTLFKKTQLGDVVLHYHKPSEAIVGVSVVSGPWSAEDITWGARSTSARVKGVRPHTRPGFIVPLAEYRQLPAPLTLEALRENRERLTEVLAELKAAHPGRATYFPFELGSRPVRPLQGYAFKLPVAFVRAFPQLASIALDGAVAEPETIAPIPVSSRQGQRYVVSPEVRRAIEWRAMHAAWAFFEAKNYSLSDVSSTKPFDILAKRDGEELHIEVKGTTGSLGTVFLTRNEVRHAEANPAHAVLFVLAEISVTVSDDSANASGGLECVYWPWVVGDGSLEPLQFQYTLPAPSEAHASSELAS
jgi:hypothetical protein